MTGTTLCPRCGAPIPWDGQAKTVNCPYCKIVVTPMVHGASPRQVAAMRSPSGGGMGVGCIIAAVVGLFVLVGVGVGAVVMLRAGASTASSAISISIAPPMPTIPAISGTTTSGTKLVATRVFGEEGDGAGQLSDARAIAVDMDENVYVADFDTLRVQKFDPTGKFVWIISVPKDEVGSNKTIWQMAVDTKNVLWVARTGGLLKYATGDGKAVGQVKGNYEDMYFKWVALDPLGNIATTHDARGDADLLLLDPNGKLKKRLKNKEAHGLAMDGSGNVYRSEDSVIEVVDTSGNVKSRFGSKKDKHTSSVSSLAIDGKGHIFAETSEGLNVFDQGGAYIKTLEGVRASRSFAISTKGNLFALDNNKISVFAIGALP